jgi:hypothetical protein
MQKRVESHAAEGLEAKRGYGFGFTLGVGTAG